MIAFLLANLGAVFGWGAAGVASFFAVRAVLQRADARGEAGAAVARANAAEGQLAGLKARVAALERSAVVDVVSLDKAAQRLADEQAKNIDRAAPGDGAEALRKAFGGKP